MIKLLIIDANSLIHRAFHALPPLTDLEGKPAGALYGISSILMKVFKDLHPDFIVAAFDRPEPTFRAKEYAAYKENRPKAADDLVSQIIRSKDVFTAFGIPCFEKSGFEADDVIGTIAEKYKSEKGIDKIMILSGDLDTLQLVDKDKVVVEFPIKGISEFTEYNESGVKERLGISPEMVPDYKGIVGDSSDNIPGVPGVGPKTAVSILTSYGSLEDFYELRPEPKTSALKKMYEGESSARMSKKLATIIRDVPVDLPPFSGLSRETFSEENLVSFFDSIGFKNLSNRLKEKGL